MMLTGAAIYLVVTDTMPKIGSVTLISRLYLSTLIHNFIALLVTIFVVSLHNISNPGMCVRWEGGGRGGGE